MAFRKRSKTKRTTIDLSTPEGAAEVRERIQETAFPVSLETESDVFVSDDAKKKDKFRKAEMEVPEIFTAEQVYWVFNLYVMVISFVYSLILKIEFSVIFDELKFDDEQAMDMAKPLAKILSKHAPKEWAGMSAEIQLITQMGVWTAMSFKRVKMVQEKEMEKKRLQCRTVPVQPMRRADAMPA